jgi:sorting nexin-8
MFNAPRPGQRYMASPSTGFGGSFVDDNPLAASAYDGLDPWSAAPTPSPPPISPPSVFSTVIGKPEPETESYRLNG